MYYKKYLKSFHPIRRHSFNLLQHQSNLNSNTLMLYSKSSNTKKQIKPTSVTKDSRSENIISRRRQYTIDFRINRDKKKRVFRTGHRIGKTAFAEIQRNPLYPLRKIYDSYNKGHPPPPQNFDINKLSTIDILFKGTPKYKLSPRLWFYFELVRIKHAIVALKNLYELPDITPLYIMTYSFIHTLIINPKKIKLSLFDELLKLYRKSIRTKTFTRIGIDSVFLLECTDPFLSFVLLEQFCNDVKNGGISNQVVLKRMKHPNFENNYQDQFFLSPIHNNLFHFPIMYTNLFDMNRCSLLYAHSCEFQLESFKNPYLFKGNQLHTELFKLMETNLHDEKMLNSHKSNVEEIDMRMDRHRKNKLLLVSIEEFLDVSNEKRKYRGESKVTIDSLIEIVRSSSAKQSNEKIEVLDDSNTRSFITDHIDFAKQFQEEETDQPSFLESETEKKVKFILPLYHMHVFSKDGEAVVPSYTKKNPFLLKVTGEIDHLLRTKDGYEIVEFKSNVTRMDVNTNLQLQVYALAFYFQYKILPHKVTLQCLTTGVAKSKRVDMGYIVASYNRINNTIHSLVSKPYKRDSNSNCSRCRFQYLCPSSSSTPIKLYNYPEEISRVVRSTPKTYNKL
mmetsp:Transcript_6849/g.10006  ORF Transcript_6849/g.10006 Transcript_6849/m.10006 type:complete len:619 (-) Transcript_6849:24-1880(-)